MIEIGSLSINNGRPELNLNTTPPDTTRIFIITRRGNLYTDEGIDYVKNEIASKWPGVNIEKLMISQGSDLCNPEILANFLKCNPRAYIILSTDPIAIYYPESLPDIIENLEECKNDKNANSWEIIVKTTGDEEFIKRQNLN